jgi:hypothetical protein
LFQINYLLSGYYNFDENKALLIKC